MGLLGVDIARGVAASLNLLGPDGELVQLDSMTTVEYVVALENEIGIDVPSTALSDFSSLAAVGVVLDKLKSGVASEP